MSEREMSLSVVGIAYSNDDKAKSSRRFEMLLCSPGDPVQLRREPKNEHDEFAVAVFSDRGTQLGYLSADRAPWIGSKIAAGDDIAGIFQAPGATAAVIRVRIGGGAPTLPPPLPPELPRPTTVDHDATAPDFYSDPDGPEWGA